MISHVHLSAGLFIVNFIRYTRCVCSFEAVLRLYHVVYYLSRSCMEMCSYWVWHKLCTCCKIWGFHNIIRTMMFWVLYHVEMLVNISTSGQAAASIFKFEIGWGCDQIIQAGWCGVVIQSHGKGRGYRILSRPVGMVKNKLIPFQDHQSR